MDICIVYPSYELFYPLQHRSWVFVIVVPASLCGNCTRFKELFIKYLRNYFSGF